MRSALSSVLIISTPAAMSACTSSVLATMVKGATPDGAPENDAATVTSSSLYQVSPARRYGRTSVPFDHHHSVPTSSAGETLNTVLLPLWTKRLAPPAPRSRTSPISTSLTAASSIGL